MADQTVRQACPVTIAARVLDTDLVKETTLFNRICTHLFITLPEMADFYKAFVSIPRTLKEGKC